MNVAAVPLPETEDRQAVIGCLRSALAALEADERVQWRSTIDELIQWRTQPLVQGLARLARELEQALGGGGMGTGGSLSAQAAGSSPLSAQVSGSSPLSTQVAGSSPLPEACARLEHVVQVSEDASHHTMDLIQECGVLLGTLPDAAAQEQAATVAAIRSRLSEMTAAQGYQDLTGQIIRRVVVLVSAVHTGLGDLAGDDRPLQLSGHGPSTAGHGPSLAGIDAPATSQDDANQLLSSLGL